MPKGVYARQIETAHVRIRPVAADLRPCRAVARSGVVPACKPAGYRLRAWKRQRAGAI